MHERLLLAIIALLGMDSRYIYFSSTKTSGVSSYEVDTLKMIRTEQGLKQYCFKGGVTSVLVTEQIHTYSSRQRVLYRH